MPYSITLQLRVAVLLTNNDKHDKMHKFYISIAIINADSRGLLTNTLMYGRLPKFCTSLTIANAGLGVVFKPLMNVIRLLMPDPNHSAKRTHK